LAGELAGLGPSLKSRALRLLALREHSRAELVRKLSRFEKAPGELTALLDALAAKGLINEARVAESVMHRRADKLGALRLRAELQQKGLASDLIDASLERVRAGEFDRARQVLARRFGAAPATEASERARRARFLISRGFAADVVRRAIDASEDVEDGF
jgi:regulatory protein